MTPIAPVPARQIFIPFPLVSLRVTRCGAGCRDRDRGKDRSSAPPTPPYVRVRIRRFDWSCYRPSTKDGSPNEVRAAFDRAMPRAGLWLTCHGPQRLPAVFAASSSFTPRRTSSAYRLRPVFHCPQKAQRTRLLTHESNRCNTEGVSQKPK